MTKIIKLTQEELKKIISERVQHLNEIEIEGGENNVDTTPEVDGSEAKLDKLFSKIPDEEKDFVIDEIKKAEKTGSTTLTYNWASSRKKWDILKYFTNVLAYKFKKNPENINLRNALMIAFSPYQANSFSNFYQYIFRMVTSYSSTFSSQEEFNDMITTSIYDGVDKTLESFSLDDGNFLNLLVTTVKNSFIDKWRKEKEHTVNGEKQTMHTTSLDSPIGNDDEESDSLGDRLADPSLGTDQEMNKNIGKKIWRDFIKAIKGLMKGNKERESILDIYIREGITKTEEVYQRMLEKGFYGGMEKITGVNSIRTNIDRMQKLIANKMSAGYFSEYIKKATKTLVNFFKLYERLPKTPNGEAFFPLEVARYDNFTNYVPAVIAEMKQADIATLLFEANVERINNINEVTTFFETTLNSNILNEWHETKVDTIDLLQKVKSFVDNSAMAIKDVISDLHEITNICFEIRNDYPGLSKEIEGAVHGMIEQILDYPNRLNNILNKVKMRYNAKPVGF